MVCFLNDTLLETQVDTKSVMESTTCKFIRPSAYGTSCEDLRSYLANGSWLAGGVSA